MHADQKYLRLVACIVICTANEGAYYMFLLLLHLEIHWDQSGLAEGFKACTYFHAAGLNLETSRGAVGPWHQQQVLPLDEPPHLQRTQQATLKDESCAAVFGWGE